MIEPGPEEVLRQLDVEEDECALLSSTKLPSGYQPFATRPDKTFCRAADRRRIRSWRKTRHGSDGDAPSRGLRRSADVIQDRHESIHLVRGEKLVWAVRGDVRER